MIHAAKRMKPVSSNNPVTAPVESPAGQIVNIAQ